MKTAIIVFPGSNCDRDVERALAAAMDRPPIMAWHQESDLPDVDLIVIPGGFSYGDYLRAGAIAAHSPIMREVTARAEQGVPVLGICNGFQVLIETRLLPGALMPNAHLKFVCCDVHLKVESTKTPFTGGFKAGDIVRMPIAHRDGNYFAEPETLAALWDNEQVAFRYCAKDGTIGPQSNPNGSLDNIAGIFNKRHNVLGMMPHPERLAEPLLGGVDGAVMFRTMVDALV